MLRITEYYDGILTFYCDNCKSDGVYNFSDRITADCTFIVEPSCQCGNTGRLYFMYCSTEYKAKELLAEFEALKLK